jgi:hypothetical protein
MLVVVTELDTYAFPMTWRVAEGTKVSPIPT